MLSLFSFLLFLFARTFASQYTFIHDANELIEFSNNVSNKITYLGSTVYLDSDIEFDNELSKLFKPIGIDSSNTHFKGTFDGHGHVIRNLNISISSLVHVGLFGISYGGTIIRNVIMDSSCSVSSYYSGSSSCPHLGSVIGCCATDNGASLVENCVNMAKVTLGEISYSYIWMGGIVGHMESRYSSITVRNCANYGDVICSTKSSRYIYLGGVVGYGNYNNQKIIQNCLNYGTVTFNSTSSSYLSVGGILGAAEYASCKIENCMSTGKIVSAVTSSYIAGILGRVENGGKASLINCVWTNDTGYDTLLGYGSSTNTGTYFDELNETAANVLNEYASNNKGWNKWLFNGGYNIIEFVLNRESFLNFTYRFILLPDLASDELNIFDGWYTDSPCLNILTAPETTEDMVLYGLYGAVVNFTLDFCGGEIMTAINMSTKRLALRDTYGEFPVVVRTGYSFAGWFTSEVDGDEIMNNTVVSIKENHVIYAHWSANKYNVTFNVNGGDELGESEKNTTVTFGSAYDFLPSPTRNGYTFAGWLTEEGEQVAYDTVVGIAKDHILYANWTANKYNVTFNVNGGDELTEDEMNMTVTFNATYDFLPNPTRNGYTLAGWLTEEGEQVTCDTVVDIAKDHILYANWTANNYTVLFNVNGGDELIEYADGITVIFDSKYDFLPTPTRTGYTFGGWINDDYGLITKDTTVNITVDCTLYANWIANTYNITFNANGGEKLVGYENGITVTFDSNYSCLPIPTKEGYTFLWWYIEDTKEKVDNKTKVETACNHTLCAAWDRNIIIFDVNGGEELSDDEKEKEVIYEGTYDSLPTPSRTGYNFDGWFSEDGDIIKEGSTINISYDQTIRAEWTANNYTMILDPNGGDALSEDRMNITVTYDDTYGEIPTPTRTGYSFTGWYTENGEFVANDTIVKDACGCTLHANWTANTYFITLDVNGGEGLTEDKKEIEVTYDGTFDSLPTPTKFGYKFDGWFTKDDDEITKETKVILANNQTLYAHWAMVSEPSKFVEVVFGKEDMSEEEIRNVLSKFTDDNFSIIDLKTNQSGETIAIIRFSDVKNAEKFITALNESSDSSKNFIRGANFNSGVDISFSTTVLPFVLFNILLV